MSDALGSILDERELGLLGELLETAVPGCGSSVSYLALRVESGLIDPAELQAVVAGPEGASDRLDAWSRAPAGSPERIRFETVRAWAWEACLCDAKWGGNVDRAGWARFGYRGRPKSPAAGDEG